MRRELRRSRTSMEEKVSRERESKGESESLTKIGEINPCLHKERASEEQKFNGGGESFGGERVEGRE
jgi:hypothetical protein